MVVRKTIKCIFCEKGLTNRKFREDYILIPWIDDPRDLNSFNKIAKCSHKECFIRFIKLNFRTIKKIILDNVKL